MDMYIVTDAGAGRGLCISVMERGAFGIGGRYFGIRDEQRGMS
jgi:hypothetical protein